jgi:tetratricopeptide (TPR) repeat protein
MITTEALEKAIEYYKQSLQIDPNYPPAYAGLAVAYGYMSYWGNIPPKEAYPIAKEYVKKALEMDNTLAIGHVSLGFINMVYDYDYKAAEQELKLGLHLNPSSAIGHMYYSFYLTLTENHNEAITEAKLAVELDPLSNYYNAQLGQSYNYAGQYDRAITELQKTISMFPNYFLSHYNIGYAYSRKSMFQEAIRHHEQAVDLSGGNPVAVSALAFAYFGNGELEKGEKLFESLELRSKNEYIPKFIFAQYNGFKGNLDLAYEWLEQAVDEHDSFIPWIIISPEIKANINDPRYMELMTKAGFVE